MWLIYLIFAIAAPVVIRHLVLMFLHRVAPIKQTRAPSPHSTMDEAEARKILGVDAHATDAEIKTAYHQLMQKLHPDAGGNDYFASQLNRARDILLATKRGSS